MTTNRFKDLTFDDGINANDGAAEGSLALFQEASQELLKGEQNKTSLPSRANRADLAASGEKNTWAKFLEFTQDGFRELYGGDRTLELDCRNATDKASDQAKEIIDDKIDSSKSGLSELERVVMKSMAHAIIDGDIKALEDTLRNFSFNPKALTTLMEELSHHMRSAGVYLTWDVAEVLRSSGKEVELGSLGTLRIFSKGSNRYVEVNVGKFAGDGVQAGVGGPIEWTKEGGLRLYAVGYADDPGKLLKALGHHATLHLVASPSTIDARPSLLPSGRWTGHTDSRMPSAQDQPGPPPQRPGDSGRGSTEVPDQLRQEEQGPHSDRYRGPDTGPVPTPPIQEEQGPHSARYAGPGAGRVPTSLTQEQQAMSSSQRPALDKPPVGATPAQAPERQQAAHSDQRPGAAGGHHHAPHTPEPPRQRR
ncbi:MAG TPA: hypothetical protein V6D08_20220 [Candidatus Obscuribacterales bacterium]